VWDCSFLCQGSLKVSHGGEGRKLDAIGIQLYLKGINAAARKELYGMGSV
jgi:hypothetical protein